MRHVHVAKQTNMNEIYSMLMWKENVCKILTEIHGCLSASVAVIRLCGFTVNI